jgi:Uma2 family endonuclease
MQVVSSEPDPGLQAIRRFSRGEYDRLVDMGWFVDERLELLHGLLVTVTPQGDRHGETIRYLNDLLARRLGERALVSPQLPFAATDDSEPEPDLAVVPRARYREHPSVAYLVIEIAQTSQRRDREKASLYAAAGVPEYWIIDLAAELVLVHTDPDPAARAYRATCEHRAGELLRPLSFPDIAIAVADLF